MIQLTDRVSKLARVGPRSTTLLKKLEIVTVEDLLYHFPFRYEDYSNVKNISQIQEGEMVTVEGTLEEIKNIYTRFGKRITKGVLADLTGRLDLVWFNQHYIKDAYKVGSTYLAAGKAGVFGKKLTMVSPEMEESVGGSGVNTARLVPVYSETAGVSSKWLRARINDVVNGASELEGFKEFLPDELLNNYELIDFEAAVKSIHFPSDANAAGSARKRFEFEELLFELLKVEKRKDEWGGKLRGYEFELVKNREKLDEFIEGLPFKLTPSQETALEEMLYDMVNPTPMNRLLEGDVGTGKTVVAAILAYFAYVNGFKTLYMAPTEILAKQHFDTFQRLLADFGLKVHLLTGGTRSHLVPPSSADVIIGTHALLFAKEKFENTGLVVVDEQHRFGVEQRSKVVEIAKGKKVPHLLTMTATPIPRTLALTLYGDLSISRLTEPPNKDKKITTKVIPENYRQKAYEVINAKNEPTFIVCPLIEESESDSMENVKAAEKEFENLKNGVFKGKSVGLLHGRMKAKEKHETIEKFRKGEIRILVSTPVIEVGIDVPEAGIMVIESAERYGLASLHQLRGRVGRGQKEGFCYVMMSTNSRQAYSRLKNLEDISLGIKLAEIDLKIRGQGDIFGTMQHGYKKLKIADLGNLELLEKAKAEAQRVYPKLSKYPKLQKKVEERSGKLVANN